MHRERDDCEQDPDGAELDSGLNQNVMRGTVPADIKCQRRLQYEPIESGRERPVAVAEEPMLFESQQADLPNLLSSRSAV